jgi:hypothetical protein
MFKLLAMNWLRRELGALAVLALVARCALSSAAEIEWKSYTSKEGRFTALFPGEVKVNPGENATHTYASPPGVDADFRVAYTDRAEPDANLKAAFKELDRVREATCKAQKVEADEVVNYLHDNLPACRFGFTKQLDGTTRARYEMLFVLDGKRFYQVLYGYSVDEPMKREGEFFAKSFKINR